jgi:hypothetical protein
LIPPTKSYAKSRDEMTPAEKAYADNTQASVTDEMIAAAEASDARGNAIAAAYSLVRWQKARMLIVVMATAVQLLQQTLGIRYGERWAYRFSPWGRFALCAGWISS